MSSFGHYWCFCCRQLESLQTRVSRKNQRNVRKTSSCLRVLTIFSVIVVVLVFACTQRFDRDRFSSRNTAAGLPKTLICHKLEAPQKHLRPPYQSFRRGASNCAKSQACLVNFHLFYKINLPKNENGAWDFAPMDAPRRELSNGGLGFVVALSVSRQINFLCVFR